MNQSTTVAPATPAFDVRAMTDEEAHAFGVAVACVFRDFDAAKARIAELGAENGALRKRVAQQDSRIALQKQTITQLRRTAGADPDELLRRIDEALGETSGAATPVAATPLPPGTVLGAVRVKRETGQRAVAPVAWTAHDCAPDPEPGPQAPVEVEAPHVCGPDCAAPKPDDHAPDASAPRWYSRLRWSR